jgi:cell division protein FtsL
VRGRADIGTSARTAAGATVRAAAGATARAATGATARAATRATARAAAGATATALAAAAEVAPRIVRPAPRITRPAPRITPPARPARAAPTTDRRGARALGFVRALPDHALTDRLVRGRAWIPVLGVLLAGIVAMQVSLLQLNASMGRSIEQGTSLQTENGLLRAQVAALGSVQRIERLATGMGLVMATPQQISFLSPRSSQIPRRAIANMVAPSASAFAATQAGASGTGQGTAAATDTATSSTPSTDFSTVAPSTGGSVASTGPSGTIGTGAPSTPASGTDSPAGVQSTGVDTGTDGTPGAAGPQSAGTQSATGAVTGTSGTSQQSSGGAAYTGNGG